MMRIFASSGKVGLLPYPGVTFIGSCGCDHSKPLLRDPHRQSITRALLKLVNLCPSLRAFVVNTTRALNVQAAILNTHVLNVMANIDPPSVIFVGHVKLPRLLTI